MFIMRSTTTCYGARGQGFATNSAHGGAVGSVRGESERHEALTPTRAQRLRALWRSMVRRQAPGQNGLREAPQLPGAAQADQPAAAVATSPCPAYVRSVAARLRDRRTPRVVLDEHQERGFASTSGHALWARPPDQIELDG